MSCLITLFLLFIVGLFALCIWMIIKDYYDFKKILKQTEEVNDLIERTIKEIIETHKMMR